MKLVILDRDGVINETRGEPIRSAQQWQPIAGSLEAIARLGHAGYRIFVATNQPSIGEGSQNFDELNSVHERMQQALAELGGKIDAICYCPHARDAGCGCRKPEPGMLRDISRRMQTELDDCWFIGDRLHDVSAAQAAGARPALVKTGMGSQTLAEHGEALSEIAVFDDLAAAVDHLLAKQKLPQAS